MAARIAHRHDSHPHWRFMVGIDKIILFPSFSCCLESLARLKFYMPNKSLTVHVSHLFPIYAILALNLSVHTLIVFLSKWTLSGRVVDNYFEILCRPPYLSCPFVLCNLLEWLCSYVFKYLYSSGKKPSFYINWTLLSDLELSSLNFHWPWIWHKLFSSSSSLFGKYFAISVCSRPLVCFNCQWK
jgi:hypothetical protein